MMLAAPFDHFKSGFLPSNKKKKKKKKQKPCTIRQNKRKQIENEYYTHPVIANPICSPIYRMNGLYTYSLDGVAKGRLSPNFKTKRTISALWNRH